MLSLDISNKLQRMGMYYQAFDTNEELTTNVEKDLIYKFYIAFHNIGYNSSYGKSYVVFLPFLLDIDGRKVTFKCVPQL